MVRWDALLILDLGFHVVDCVGGLDFEGYGLARQGFDEAGEGVVRWRPSVGCSECEKVGNGLTSALSERKKVNTRVEEGERRRWAYWLRSSRWSCFRRVLVVMAMRYDCAGKNSSLGGDLAEFYPNIHFLPAEFWTSIIQYKIDIQDAEAFLQSHGLAQVCCHSFPKDRRLTYSRKALLLGAGFVVKPTLTLLSDKGVEVTVGKLAGGWQKMLELYHKFGIFETPVHSQNPYIQLFLHNPQNMSLYRASFQSILSTCGAGYVGY